MSLETDGELLLGRSVRILLLDLILPELLGRVGLRGGERLKEGSLRRIDGREVQVRVRPCFRKRTANDSEGRPLRVKEEIYSALSLAE